MTKVLFLGHYREPTGWGQAARDYILAMDSVGIDIVPRCINVGPSIEQLPKRLLELEQKSSKNCDVCIQNLLPHFMEYNGNFRKNIALFYTETDNVLWTNWPDKINCMSEAWVPNYDMIKVCRNSGIKLDISLVHTPVDDRKYTVEYQPLDLPNVADNYIFYFIGELTRRKNIVALLKAFHCEFEPTEAVSLVIKTNKSGLSPQQVAQNMYETTKAVKEQLKLYTQEYSYKKEIIISERLSEHDIYRLHKRCDCFVMPSFGEGWCIPAMDALGLGNPVLGTNFGGLVEFVNENNGILIDGQEEPVFGMTDTFPWLGTGRENWININVKSLQKAMRQMFENKDRNSMAGYCMATPSRFNYEVVGNKIKELLND